MTTLEKRKAFWTLAQEFDQKTTGMTPEKQKAFEKATENWGKRSPVHAQVSPLFSVAFKF